MESMVEVTEKVLVVILTAVRVDAIRVDVFTEPAIGLLVNRVDTDKVDTPNVFVIVLFIVTVEPVSVDKLNEPVVMVEPVSVDKLNEPVVIVEPVSVDNPLMDCEVIFLVERVDPTSVETDKAVAVPKVLVQIADFPASGTV
jgi:hypothetical protein